MKKALAFAAFAVVLVAVFALAGEADKPGEKKDFTALIKRLGSPDEAVVRAAMDELAKAEGSEGALKDALKSSETVVAERIFKILEAKNVLRFEPEAKLLALPGSQKRRYYLWKLKTGSQKQKVDCLWYFWSWKNVRDEVYEPAIEFFNSGPGDEKAVLQVLRVLSLLKNPESKSLFQSVLTMDLPYKDEKLKTAMRSVAASGLGLIGSREAVAALEAAWLREKAPEVKAEICLALGRARFQGDGKILEGALEDNAGVVRAYAIRGLVERGEVETTDVFFAMIEDKDPLVRAWAALALGKFGEEDALKVLEERAKKETGKENAFIRDAIMIARFRLGAEYAPYEIERLQEMKYGFIRLAASIALLERGSLGGMTEYRRRFENYPYVDRLAEILKKRIPSLPDVRLRGTRDEEAAARLEFFKVFHEIYENLKWNSEKGVFEKPGASEKKK